MNLGVATFLGVFWGDILHEKIAELPGSGLRGDSEYL